MHATGLFPLCSLEPAQDKRAAPQPILPQNHARLQLQQQMTDTGDSRSWRKPIIQVYRVASAIQRER